MDPNTVLFPPNKVMKRATSLGAPGAAGLRLFGERKTKVIACPMPARLNGKKGERLR